MRRRPSGLLALAGATALSATGLTATACRPGESRAERDGEVARDTAARVAPPADVTLPGIVAGAPPYTVAPAADAGTVTGRVTLVGPAPPDTAVTPDSLAARACGTRLVDRTVQVQGGAIAGVVVWLADARRGRALPERRRFELTLERCQLVPRALAAVTGGTLNVHGLDRIPSRLRFARFPAGRVVDEVRMTDAGQVVPTPRPLAEPGAVEVRGTLHPWLRSWVLVFDHPYHATTDATGRFTLGEVPPGTYTLVAWHERLGRVERRVTVGAGGAAEVAVEMGGGAAGRGTGGVGTAATGAPTGAR